MTDNHTVEDSDGAWAPDAVFEAILQYTVIATFDLILEFPKGILLARRRLAPYKGLWALPGLRMLKGETFDQSLRRIARTEAGVRVDAGEKIFVNQAVRKFNSPIRQDLSTCYAFRLNDQEAQINQERFSGSMYIKAETDIPESIGGIYREHLERYFTDT